MPSTTQPPVPFVDLAAQHAAIDDELTEAFTRVLGASSFTLGQEVAAFEAEFAAYCGVAECVGVASGTAALTIALLAAGVGAGDEVIVPAHTYIASALGVMHAGATPVLCDVEQGTGLIDVDSAASVIGKRTAAILPVHLYGQMCDMESVTNLADRHGLLVLEDAAQSHGATERGQSPGSTSAAAAFSFYPSKNLGALGDGGAITTNDAALGARARELRNLGQRAKGEHVVAGFNERLDGLQAALLRVKLPHLDAWNERRRELGAHYERALQPSELELLEIRPRSQCVYHVYPVRTVRRAALAEALRSEGVQTGIHYSPSLRDQPPLADLAGAPDLSRAARWAARELSLPLTPDLRVNQLAHVAEICTKFCD